MKIFFPSNWSINTYIFFVVAPCFDLNLPPPNLLHKSLPRATRDTFSPKIWVCPSFESNST